MTKPRTLPFLGRILRTDLAMGVLAVRAKWTALVEFAENQVHESQRIAIRRTSLDSNCGVPGREHT